MKKLVLTLLLLAGFTLQGGAQNTPATITRFEGKTIDRVTVGAFFNVKLSQGKDTRAVVRIDPELEPYLVCELEGSTLTLNLNIVQTGKKSDIPALQNRVMEADIVVSSLESLNVSGFCKVSCQNKFTGRDVRINIGGSTSVSGLDCSSQGPLNAEVTGFAHLTELSLAAQGNMSVQVSGSSDIKGMLTLNGRQEAKIGLSGFSSVGGLQAVAPAGVYFTAEGSSQLRGTPSLTTNGPAILKLSGFAQVNAPRIQAQGDLTLTMGGSSGLRGNAAWNTSGKAQLTLGGFSKLDKTELTARSLGLSQGGSSACSVETNTGDIQAEMTGFASCVLAGKAESLVLATQGSAKLDAKALTVRRAVITASGFASVAYQASDTASVVVSGSASVRYGGVSPSVPEVTGHASIRPL